MRRFKYRMKAENRYIKGFWRLAILLVTMEAFMRLLIVLLAGMINTSAAEPVCSPYDYEDKLLTKTIRIQDTAEELVKRITQTETDLAEIPILSTKVKEMETRLNEMAAKVAELEQEPALQIKPCPPNYKYNPFLNQCLRLQKGLKLNYFEAEERCYEDGAHLMILNNTDVIEFMHEMLKAAGFGDVFIGANDIKTEGIFIWSNGETLQQIPWLSSEPNGERDSNCVVLRGNKFCDRECSSKEEFICQKTFPDSHKYTWNDRK